MTTTVAVGVLGNLLVTWRVEARGSAMLWGVGGRGNATLVVVVSCLVGSWSVQDEELTRINYRGGRACPAQSARSWLPPMSTAVEVASHLHCAPGPLHYTYSFSLAIVPLRGSRAATLWL